MLLNKLTDCLVAYSCFVLCTELGECHCNCHIVTCWCHWWRHGARW